VRAALLRRVAPGARLGVAVRLGGRSRLRAEHDALEIGVDSLDAVLGVLLLALKALLALRVLLRLAVDLLPPLLEIVVGFSRQMRSLRSVRALGVGSAARPGRR
jgi:hypothetical protein